MPSRNYALRYAQRLKERFPKCTIDMDKIFIAMVRF